MVTESSPPSLETQTSRALTVSFWDEARKERAATSFVERDGMLSLPLHFFTEDKEEEEEEGAYGGRRGRGRGRERRRCPLSALGECAAETCGCHRVKVPQARARLEQVVVHFMQKRGGEVHEDEGLVYASVGSGHLLSDAVVLEKLRLTAHVPAIRRCILVDTLYGAFRQEAMPERKRARLEQALEQFTSWMKKRSRGNFPAEVLVFHSLDQYDEACRLDPTLKADLLLQCDAAAIENNNNPSAQRESETNHKNDDRPLDRQKEEEEEDPTRGCSCRNCERREEEKAKSREEKDVVLLLGSAVLRDGCGMFFRLSNHGLMRKRKGPKCPDHPMQKQNRIMLFEARDDICRKEGKKREGEGERLPFSIEAYRKVANRRNLLVVMDKILHEETNDERCFRFHLQLVWSRGLGGFAVYEVVFSPRIAVRSGAGLFHTVKEVLRRGDQVVARATSEEGDEDADGNKWLQLVQGITPGKLLLHYHHPLPTAAGSGGGGGPSLSPFETDAKCFGRERGYVMLSHPKHGQLVKKISQPPITPPLGVI